MINYEQFIEKYKPINNPNNVIAGFDGLMFDTFGKDLDYVKSKGNHSLNVWTLVTADYGNEYIIPGYSIVNRMGYFITELPWDSSNYEQVDLNEYVSLDELVFTFNSVLKQENVHISMEEVYEYFEDKLYTENEAMYRVIDFLEENYPDLKENRNLEDIISNAWLN